MVSSVEEIIGCPDSAVAQIPQSSRFRIGVQIPHPRFRIRFRIHPDSADSVRFRFRSQISFDITFRFFRWQVFRLVFLAMKRR